MGQADASASTLVRHAVLGGPTAAARQAKPKPTGAAQDKQTVSVVDVATGRSMKGHS